MRPIIFKKDAPRKILFLYPFYNDYWTTIPEENSSDENFDANPDDFVTDYAAKNIAEDLAETMRVYVLSNKPSSVVLVKDQKVSSFYEYETLNGLRDYIRENIESENLLTEKNNKLAHFKGCATSLMMKKRHLKKYLP